MEALKRQHALLGCAVVFLSITTFSKAPSLGGTELNPGYECWGSPWWGPSLRGADAFSSTTCRSSGFACEPPSSPLCFRKIAEDSVYCQWDMNTTGTAVTYDIYFKSESGYEKPFPGIKDSWFSIGEDALVKDKPVHVWVKAYSGNSSCQSKNVSVTLRHAVKYDAPNVSVSWLKRDLVLGWPAAEASPAVAQVRLRMHQRPWDPWENRTANTSIKNSTYQVTVENLLKHTAYQAQVRHRSGRALSPLWSDWSPLVTVPAELDQEPVFSIKTKVTSSTRKITLTLEPALEAAAVAGLTYGAVNTQSSIKCPCNKVQQHIKGNLITMFVSHSAVNVSVTARNAAGVSPAAVASVGRIRPTMDLDICNSTLVGKKLKKRNCLELYEFQDGDWRPAHVITSGKGKNKNETMKDLVYYLYFEHRCSNHTPHTDKMCVFYHKEGVPLTEPLDFKVFDESSTSVSLSWKRISTGDLRGFLSHYSLCIIKINSEEKDEACCNVSKSALQHCLVNLTPGSKYNISLAAVTGGGEGPRAIRFINTLPEKRVAVVLWVLSGMFVIFFISSLGTCVCGKVKRKIFPPVLMPVTLDFTSYRAQAQMTLERPEEVDELMLYQLQPESRSTPERAEKTPVIREWYGDEDKDESEGEDNGEDEDEGEHEDEDEDEDEDTEENNIVSGMSEDYEDEHLNSTDLELKKSREAGRTHLDKEIEMLIYRNGLVFDVKTD